MPRRAPRANPFQAMLAPANPANPANPAQANPAPANPAPANPASGSQASASPEAESQAPASPDLPFRARGGYSLPGLAFAAERRRLGRTGGQVLVEGGELVLQPRRRLAARLMPPIHLGPEDLLSVAPTVPDVAGSYLGAVGLRADGQHCYVWVEDPPALLRALEAAGFTISPVPIEVKSP